MFRFVLWLSMRVSPNWATSRGRKLRFNMCVIFFNQLDQAVEFLWLWLDQFVAPRCVDVRGRGCWRGGYWSSRVTLGPGSRLPGHPGCHWGPAAASLGGQLSGFGALASATIARMSRVRGVWFNFWLSKRKENHHVFRNNPQGQLRGLIRTFWQRQTRFGFTSSAGFQPSRIEPICGVSGWFSLPPSAEKGSGCTSRGWGVCGCILSASFC